MGGAVLCGVGREDKMALVLAMQAAWRGLTMRLRGMRRRVIEIEEFPATVYCWTPKAAAMKKKPALLLLHGFGTDGTAAWAGLVPSLCQHFSLFIPDLLFFGDSSTTNRSRSEFFQAKCMHALLHSLGVSRVSVVGHSYGGFVAYRLAHLFPSLVSKLVIMSSGVMMDPHSNDDVIRKCGASSIHDVLVPTSPLALQRTLQLVLNKPVTLPKSVLKALLKFPYRAQRLELIDAIALGKEDSPTLPKVSQKTLILWGDEDQIFNVNLAIELQKFLGAIAELKIYKGIGHVPQIAKGLDKDLISFLLEIPFP